MTWKIFLGNALLVVLALVASTLLIASEVARKRNDDRRADLAIEAALIARLAEQHDPHDATAPLARRLAGLADAGRTVIVLDAAGNPLLTLGADFSAPDQMLSPAERERAMRAGDGHAAPRSARDRREMIAVARRIGPAEKPTGLVLLTRPAWSFAGDWNTLTRLLGQIVLVAIITTTLLAVGLARLWARPLRQVIRTARDLSRGDLSARAVTMGNDELALLARALNRMRDRLVRNYQTIDRQRRTLELLLKQLREGVIVADAAGRIVLLNPAAVRLLNFSDPDTETLIGKAIERCIPQHDLQRMLHQPRSDLTRITQNGDPTLIEARVQIEHEHGTRYLLAHASDLRLIENEREHDRANTGRLLVLTDVTALTRAIEIKTDFVANASHELRTPLSTIRAAVETLQRMDLNDDAEAARRFISVIERQSKRLEALGSDLLELARLEAADQPPQHAELSIDTLLADLRLNFADRIAARNIEWRSSRTDQAQDTLVANRHLLQLILDNLVDNAVKFTEPGGYVRVACDASNGHAVFTVEDNGCGIPEEDRMRVFERFYQVERARSGQARGTGLGLAIVRHAVAALGGEVELESQAGRGTRVTVRIPHQREAHRG